MDNAESQSAEVDDRHLVELIAQAVAERLTPPLPLSIQLWNAKIIAAYLQRSPAVVLERVVTLPGFPPPIRLPSTRSTSKSIAQPHSDKSTGQPLWKATEVIDWVDSHRRKCVGRPRARD
ncbi:hypothetical protein [Pandoraea soli]|uniref:hypothetical protein n=1 Tax=Pandoraea soli TaxID=2508293 RepID=UPI0012406EF9|nr:hypothetical protein [Pandoraea soli]